MRLQLNPSPKMRALALSVCAAALFAYAPVQAKPSAALIEARHHIEDANIRAVTFRSMDRFFPTETVNAGTASKLPRKMLDLKPDVTFTVGGAKQTVDFQTALEKTYTNALLVIHNGNIVYEQYLNGSDENSRFMSWSIAKSVTSILVGAALERGYIKSLNDPIEKYLTDLKGTAYEGVTIEQLLMMREGTNYLEQTDARGEGMINMIKDRSIVRQEIGFSRVEGLNLKRINEPGSTFNYSTLTSGILGRLVDTVAGKSLAKFTEEVLWKPAGMEASGYWLLDNEPPKGLGMGGSGYNATLRDFGRIGLMMLNEGKVDGKKVLSAEYVKQSTRTTDPKPVIPGAPRGYQYQWWTMKGTELFEAIGIHGQFMSVDRATNTIIVKMSYWPEKGGSQYNFDTFALFKSIRDAVTAAK